VTAAPLSERARRELLAAAAWIAEDNPIAAEGLIHAVEEAAKGSAIIRRSADAARN
jgi:plasmid stabilization system protein ParE